VHVVLCFVTPSLATLRLLIFARPKSEEKLKDCDKQQQQKASKLKGGKQ